MAQQQASPDLLSDLEFDVRWPGSRIRGWLSRHRLDLIAIGIFVLAGLLVTARLWVDVNHRATIINHADPVLLQWALAHAAHAVAHLQNPLFAPEQNVPDGANAAANTTILGVGIPMAPVTLLLGPAVSYAVLLTLGPAATAAGAYVVFSRHLVRSWSAAVVAAGLVGFAPGIMWHAYGQLHLVVNFLLPPIVLLALRLGAPGHRLRRAVLLGALVAWQVLISSELIMVAAAGCLFVVAAYAVLRPSSAAQMAVPFLTASATAIATAGLLLVYPLWFAFFGPQHFNGVPAVFEFWGEDLTAYVTVGPYALGHPDVIWTSEQNSLLGWPLVAVTLVVTVALWRRTVAVRVAFLTAIAGGLLAAGPRFLVDHHLTAVPGPFALLSRAPLFNLALPTRFSLIVVVAVAVILALVWERLVQVKEVQLRMLALGALVSVLVPLCPMPLRVEGVPPIPAFISDGTWHRYIGPGQTLVPVPLPSNQDYGLTGLRWSARTINELAIPEGYFIAPDRNGTGRYGPVPSPTSELITGVTLSGQVPTVTEAMRAQAQADLRRWRAAVVVLSPDTPHKTALTAATTLLLGFSPTWVDGVWLWDVRSLVATQ